MRASTVRSICILFACLTATRAGEVKAPSVFDLPRVQAVQAFERRAILALMTKGDYKSAEKRLRKSIARIPHDFNAHYNLACALARLGKRDKAFARLQEAVELGFRNRKHIAADTDLKSLHGDDRFQKILKAAESPRKAPAKGWKYRVEPTKPSKGRVLVTENNVGWNSRLGVFQAFFKFTEGGANQPVAVGLGKAGEALRRWYGQGTAAGNHGDLYDNHDNGHSKMNFGALPQFTRVEFSDAAKIRQLHNGLQRFFIYNAVTIGNSSTAITSGPFWRSQGRLALTRPGGAQLLYLHYRANHLYFYPEHKDHDEKHGDVFPANTPYLILSQGSSGSDRVFLDATAATLAAFRPKVKKALTKSGMLMPTVQMIFRRSNKLVKSPADYLTAKAHPTVFDGKQLDVGKMVKLAHDMHPESLPPLVQIKVVEEDNGIAGLDYFDAGGERLFDTPCAIARVVKSTKYLRRMVVSAGESRDLHGKPLTFHWVVLRGDAGRIRINRRNESGSVVELLVPYHERRPVTRGAKLESNRVDIGVFADNGDYHSAPAFISLFYLNNEKRTYDQQHRIRIVDYAHKSVRSNYVDPQLAVRKEWRDEYRYGDDGKLLGWTRHRANRKEEFTAAGRLVVQRDDRGQATKTREVRYIAKSGRKGGRVLMQVLVNNPLKRKSVPKAAGVGR